MEDYKIYSENKGTKIAQNPGAPLLTMFTLTLSEATSQQHD